jgi:hypothetical protein
MRDKYRKVNTSPFTMNSKYRKHDISPFATDIQELHLDIYERGARNEL